MTETKYLDLQGERVAYLDEGPCLDVPASEGPGEVILLLHGMGGSSQTWRSVIGPLSRHHRVVAPDLLGHGDSAKPRSDYSLGAFAVLLRDFLDELGITEATIVGHSLGGGIAMQFIYQHPDYGKRLVLVGSGGLGPDVGLTLRLMSLPGAEFVLPVIAPQPVLTAGDRLWTWLRKAGIQAPRGEETWRAYSSLADAPTREAFLRTLRAVVDRRGQAVCALTRMSTKTSLPILVIWGEQDAIIPVEHAYAIQRVRPDARLEVLADVGHYPQVERPTEVAALIEEFVDEGAAADSDAHRLSSSALQ